MTPPPSHVLTVCAGGALGAGLRELLVLACPTSGFDTTVLAINVVGAFVLGALLTWLAGRGPDEGARRTARLLVGTGVLGGFTTYSTLAVDTARLLQHHRAGMALAYVLATVLLGAVASLAGIRAGDLLLGRAVALADDAALDDEGAPRGRSGSTGGHGSGARDGSTSGAGSGVAGGDAR